MPIRTRELADKWQKRSDILQFSTLIGILAAILVLGSVPERAAQILVPVFMIFLFMTATLGYIASKKAPQYKLAYLSRVLEASYLIEDNAHKS